MHKKRQLSFLLVITLLVVLCSKSNDLVIVRQVTGPTQTNTYLLYDTGSKEAALFDVGGSIDSLESIIEDEGLTVRYLFITHAHCDHVEGIPEIKKKYPHAKIGVSREEYEDMELYERWEELLDPEEVAGIKQYPEVAAMANFDYETLGEPEIYLEDEQSYALGGFTISTFLSPGHSRGSICFYAGNVLISGDVLFHRRVGRTDFLNSGGWDEIVKSVHRLYASLPDETKVYPGHGPSTDIGSEKRENEELPLESVNLTK